MAITTFSQNVAAFFPAGTSLGAYPESNYPAAHRPPTAGVAPLGAATATASVDSTGLVSFTGLADSTVYYLSDSGGTKHLRITTLPSTVTENVGHKDRANGYPGLDTGGKVPRAEIPFDYYDIRTYGAVADTVTNLSPVNSSTAIQAAVDAAQAAGGGVVYVPPLPVGRCWRCNVVIKPGVFLVGDGWRSELRTMPNASAAVVGSKKGTYANLTLAVDDPYHCGIRNLKVTAYSGSTSQTNYLPNIRAVEFVSSNADAFVAGSASMPGGWNDPSVSVEGCLIYQGSGDALLYMGANMRGSWVKRTFLFSANATGTAAARLVATDTQWESVQAALCGTGVVVTGQDNQFTGCKSWYHATGTAPAGNGYGWELRAARNQLSGCKTQDNGAYGVAIIGASGNRVDVQSGGDLTGICYLNGAATNNNVHTALVDADVAPASANCSVMLDGSGVANNSFEIEEYSSGYGATYQPVRTANGGLTHLNGFRGGLRGGSALYAPTANKSGASDFSSVTSGVRTMAFTINGNITISAVTAKGCLPGQVLTWIITQDATGGRTITWDASFKNTPTTVTAANGITTGTFVNTATDGGAPTWQRVT